ncbi:MULTISPECIES: alkyl/aryl-sulfatase [Rhodococcus]|uniref:alkyl/aryl-sulfatase n=1 Tax=Rhodococcus TaxID=1827 RepID=UPI000750F3A7|nr:MULTISPECIES: alkyl sulfatase dimerization domain-containing protein [Rhodococcus]MDJ0398337.1 alkyl sulfatase dimerization domain-containing protein [Rhodococcus rhodochrous]MDO1482398.1 MBL fold metallo-hydrolase [Rhodococcus rhodochrous]WSE20799.1 alkyl sulfatase dimerization domain-containing protein [Rhodococcus sp. PD04]SNV20638.1 metallo-beta-lactamase superfamily protein [Rhodococcus rhodochrous]
MSDPSADMPAAGRIRQADLSLPFSDVQDFDDVDRGFIAALEPGIVRNTDGDVVWDSDSYAFLEGDCPPTVNPSLWRQSRLCARQGLFEVGDRIYQVRGLDLSNMTLVEGDTGVIVIDPLISAETAAAGLALYRAHRGDRPVTGVIYTHSHIDHFGGVKGVTRVEDVEAGRCPVLAPAGFVEHAVAENVYAGTAMGRRAAYMYGAALPRGPRGAVGAGLGPTTSTGTPTLITPTIDIEHTGQAETVDGVEIEFQMTPGTEAPAEMNFYFPQLRALCMAENATHTLHNLLTLRGALVRDPHVWSQYLTESINRFAYRSDVLFASHHWPTWGTERLTEYLSLQRDLYGYLHDQTLRAINRGATGIEIAESIELPPAIEKVWHTRGYYGSVSHNVKAIYQRYMGWFDGNPAHLWEHPPVESAMRHIEFMGGADQVLEKARRSFEDGDFRWVAQVLNYVIFADPDNAQAKALQADALEQLGFGSENGTWRNFFLMGAYELRHGAIGTPTVTTAPDIVGALTIDQIFDALALRVDGPRAWSTTLTIDWNFTDENSVHRTRLCNGLLVHFDTDGSLPAPDTTITLTRSLLIAVLLGGADPASLVADGSITVDGADGVLAMLVSVLDEPDPDFAIVTP